MSSPEVERHVSQARSTMAAAGLAARPGTPGGFDPETTWQRVVAASQEPAPARIAQPRRPRRRAAAILAPVAAVLVVALVLVLQPTTPAAASPPAPLTFTASSQQASGASASAVLTRLAALSAQRAPAGNNGSVQYVRTGGWYQVDPSSCPGCSGPTQTDSWLMPDGSRVTQTTAAASMTAGGTRLPDFAASAPSSGARLQPATIDPYRITSLSRYPAQLRAQLLSTSSCVQELNRATETGCLIASIDQLYSFYVVPPDLEVAIWQMLAAQPGMQVFGDTTDRTGQPALGVGTSTDGVNTWIVLADPATGRITGVEHVLRKSNGQPLVTGFSSYLASRWVAPDAVPAVSPQPSARATHGS